MATIVPIAYNTTFDGTSQNVAIVDSSNGVVKGILWDNLSAAQQAALQALVAPYGAFAPTTATAGVQQVNFTPAVTGTTPVLGLTGPGASSAGTTTIAFTRTPAVTPATALGIAAGPHTVEVAVNGGTSTVYTVTATGTDTMTSMAALLQAAVPGVTVAAVGNAWVFTSTTIGAASSVAVTIPASSGTDLVGAVNTALTATNGNVAVAGSNGGPASFNLELSVNGAAPANYAISNVGITNFTSLAAAMTTAIGVAGTVTVANGGLLFTSALTGLASSMSIGSGSFGNGTSGTQVINFGGTVIASNPTNFVPATTYTTTITIDGVAYPVSFLGSAAPTFGRLITILQQAIGGKGRVTLTNGLSQGGDIRVTSASVGTTSTVTVIQGTVFTAPTTPGFVAILASVPGTNPGVFKALLNKFTLGSPVAGAARFADLPVTGANFVLTFATGTTGATATNLANDGTVYPCAFQIDSTYIPIAIVGSTAQTFTTLASVLQTALAAAVAGTTATVVGNTIVIQCTTAQNIQLVSNVAFARTSLFVRAALGAPVAITSFADLLSKSRSPNGRSWLSYLSGLRSTQPGVKPRFFVRAPGTYYQGLPTGTVWAWLSSGAAVGSTPPNVPVGQ